MLRIVNLLARSAVGRDRRDLDALQCGATRAAKQLGLERNHLTLIRAAIRRAGRLRVRDVLRDDVEAGFLRIQRAGRYVDSRNEIHRQGRSANRTYAAPWPVIASRSCLILLETISVRKS